MGTHNHVIQYYYRFSSYDVGCRANPPAALKGHSNLIYASRNAFLRIVMGPWSVGVITMLFVELPENLTFNTLFLMKYAPDTHCNPLSLTAV